MSCEYVTARGNKCGAKPKDLSDRCATHRGKAPFRPCPYAGCQKYTKGCGGTDWCAKHYYYSSQTTLPYPRDVDMAYERKEFAKQLLEKEEMIKYLTARLEVRADATGAATGAATEIVAKPE